MKQLESAYLLETLQACACHRIQFLDSKRMNAVGLEHLMRTFASDQVTAGFLWRNNSGAMRKGKYFLRFGMPGSSDLLGILRGGRLLAIEVKQPGQKPTSIQSAFIDMVRKLRGIAFVSYGFESADGALKAEGL